MDFVKNIPRPQVDAELRTCVYDPRNGAYWGKDFIRIGRGRPALARYEVGEPCITDAEIGLTVARAQEKLAGYVGVYVIRVPAGSDSEIEQSLREIREEVERYHQANTP